jgi:hypothetical protein
VGNLRWNSGDSTQVFVEVAQLVERPPQAEGRQFDPDPRLNIRTRTIAHFEVA